MKKQDSNKSLAIHEEDGTCWCEQHKENQDLKASSRANTIRQLVNENCRKKGATIAKSILNDVKHKSGCAISFSDEKLFDKVLNYKHKLHQLSETRWCPWACQTCSLPCASDIQNKNVAADIIILSKHVLPLSAPFLIVLMCGSRTLSNSQRDTDFPGDEHGYFLGEGPGGLPVH